MPELIRKVIETDIKEVSDRVLEFVGSTEKQDRDGELIKADGWLLKNYKKNPVFMWAHDYRQPPIGKAVSVGIKDGSLKFKIEFADEETYPFADTIYRLFKGGFLNATSVGFMPKEWSDGDGEKAPRRTYTKQELLELSAVPVPSNPDALQQAVDDGCITVKELGDCQTKWIEPMGDTASEIETDSTLITKPEETDDFIRIPVAECDVTATIDISKEEGIKALYCGKEKKVKTYLFDKRPPYNWTMAKAKKWVEEHKSGVTIEHKERGATQAEIIDELDYLIRLIDTEGMNDEVKEDAWNLVGEVMRLTGGDIPDYITEKVGAVLNTKNRGRLEQIKNIAQQILDSAEKPEQEEPKKEEVTTEVVRAIVAKAVTEAIEKAKGKV